MNALAPIIAQHAEDAALLWILRSAALSSPHYALADLTRLDARLEAQLDGLRIAGDEGWGFCVQQLETNEIGEVFVASVLAFESGNGDRIELAVKAGIADAELSSGLVSALAWLPAVRAEGYAKEFLASNSPARERVGLAALTAHGWFPGEVLKKHLGAEEMPLRAQALKTIGELGRAELSENAVAALGIADAEVRFWGAWSATLLAGGRNAITALQAIAEMPGRRQQQALEMAIRRLPFSDAKEWWRVLMQRAELRRIALIGAGILGDPETIPWLLENMRPLASARLAGEAFYSITGAHIAYRDLERKPPADFHAGPTEDPKDENVDMDPDDNLPWPEPTLVGKWWEKNRGKFKNGTRYLLGMPMTVDCLKMVLRDGYQRQRAAAALELAIRNPGQPLFNVKAPGFSQISRLGKPGRPIR